MFLAGLTALLFLIGAVIWWSIAPKWVPLFSYTLPDASQKEILDVFSREGIAYKINEESHSILLKEGDIQAAHKILASNDLPKASSDGLEMFNNSDYGLSEFAQNINYQRGMEEELARTIMRMNGIKNVRVHLTIKKDSLFEDRKQEPKASVVISFKEGVFYDSSRVRGIQEVISAAIPNLPSKNVVIITDRGDIISASDANDSMLAVTSAEAKYNAILVNLLDGVLGENQYKLSINVLMDYKKKVSVKETFYPDATNGKGFLTKKKSTNRSAGDSLSDTGSVGQNSSEEEYIYSKEKSEIVYPVGEIAKISIGLVVLTPLNQNIQNSLDNLIRTAVGMDSTRGDSISIIASHSPIVAEQTNNENGNVFEGATLTANVVNDDTQSKNYLNFLLTLSIILCILFVLFFILYIRAKKNTPAPISAAEKQQLVSDLIKWMK